MASRSPPSYHTYCRSGAPIAYAVAMDGTPHSGCLGLGLGCGSVVINVSLFGLEAGVIPFQRAVQALGRSQERRALRTHLVHESALGWRGVEHPLHLGHARPLDPCQVLPVQPLRAGLGHPCQGMNRRHCRRQTVECRKEVGLSRIRGPGLWGIIIIRGHPVPRGKAQLRQGLVNVLANRLIVPPMAQLNTHPLA
jgi:hypothetical protein